MTPLRAAALRSMFGNADLRRLHLAQGLFIAGGWAFVLGVGVSVYERHGAAAVGTLGVARLAPAALLAPLVTGVTDRFPRRRVLVAVDATRSVGIAVCALAVAHGSVPAVFVLAVLVTVVSTVLRPTRWALVPHAARTPAEVTASNSVAGLVEGLATVAGPLAAGAVLQARGAAGALVASAALHLLSAVAEARLTIGGTRPVQDTLRRGAPPAAGLRVVSRDPDVRLVVALFTAEMLVRGMFNVLVLVVALSLLDLGPGGAGYLVAAVGAGAFAAGVVAGARLRPGHLATAFRLGLILWGLPLVLLGTWPSPSAAYPLLLAVGVGNTLVDAAGITLVQRLVPDAALGRVLGALEGAVTAAFAAGAVAVPPLVAVAGAQGALVASGLPLVVLAVGTWDRLGRIGASASRHDRRLEALRAIEMFDPLPLATLDSLAYRLQPLQLPAGAHIFSKGDTGESFYLIVEGQVEIHHDGGRALLGPGDFFGEIALLRATPRTGTACSATRALLYRLDGDAFLAAVAEHPRSREAADAVVRARLCAVRESLPVL